MPTHKRLAQFIKSKIAIILLFMLQIPLAQAGQMDASMPWVSPLQKVLASITGPVAKILGTIVIVIAGLGIAYGEAGSGMRKVFQIILGLSIAFTAASLLTTLFGVTA